jgi:hypothetical protein
VYLKKDWLYLKFTNTVQNESNMSIFFPYFFKSYPRSFLNETRINYSVFKKGLYRMLEPSRHVKAMSNVGVGPPFPLIEKKSFNRVWTCDGIYYWFWVHISCFRRSPYWLMCSVAWNWIRLPSVWSCDGISSWCLSGWPISE